MIPAAIASVPMRAEEMFAARITSAASPIEQQRSQPSATGTKGTVFGRLMVRGNWRARRKPAQNGQRQRVAPSLSGAA
jgi:hypothetical protein